MLFGSLIFSADCSFLFNVIILSYIGYLRLGKGTCVIISLREEVIFIYSFGCSSKRTEGTNIIHSRVSAYCKSEEYKSAKAVHFQDPLNLMWELGLCLNLSHWNQWDFKMLNSPLLPEREWDNLHNQEEVMGKLPQQRLKQIIIKSIPSSFKTVNFNSTSPSLKLALPKMY